MRSIGEPWCGLNQIGLFFYVMITSMFMSVCLMGKYDQQCRVEPKKFNEVTQRSVRTPCSILWRTTPEVRARAERIRAGMAAADAKL